MAEVQLPSEKVPLLAQDLGVLLGLFSQRSRQLYFQFDFFGDAVNQLKKVPSRRAEMMKLLRDLLGKPAPATPADRSWYSVDRKGRPTHIYIVLPKDESGTTSTIGTGLLANFAKGSATVQASLYVPLFNLPVSSPLVITGTTAFPVELTLLMSLGTTITAGGVSFDGIRLDAKITFSGAPAFALAFTKQGQTQSVAQTVDALRSATMRDAVNTLLANDTVVSWLDQNLGDLPIKVGDAFLATGVLKQPSAGKYQLDSLDTLVSKTPKQIAELLLARALEKLAAQDKPILALGNGGIRVFGHKDGTATDYGLRIQVEDVDLSPAKGPNVLLQVGKVMSTDDEKQHDTWISRSDPEGSFTDPGISYTLVRIDAAKTPSFRPKVDLISVGLDIRGANEQPLLDVNGVTLGGVEPRFLMSFDLADLSKIPWGIGMRCHELGIPLGNGLSGASANPIAQNLLSSGSSDSGESEPVNPSFSATISRVFDPANDTTVNVHLEQDGNAAETVWIPMQRAFGPLQCRRVGVEWPDENPDLLLTFLFDGGVRLAALAVDLEGLSLGIPLRAPGQINKYTIDLQGLGLSYVSGPLTITAGFLKNTRATPIQYDGAAMIQARRWSIAAIGSYAVLGGEPSLFIFARLGATLGGPPAFFVTGLCAGFGYNRSIRLPQVDQVKDFPLLAGVDDPAKIGGANATPAQALAKLKDWVEPAQGMNWFAAGVQFTSFQLVKSNAVLVVIPTGDFQAAILGISRLKLAQEGPQFAYAELAFSAVLQPSQGFLGLTAVLSKNSYVITPECHLTGGFAFWLWFSGEHSGDFVITLGGYHPAFVKPAHYPDVPRLGFSWHVNNNVTIRGAAYFALTPSCAMAGGALDVEFHSGDLRAWFRAHADFLFVWKPFYFIGSVGVSVGASYKLNLGFTSTTISVELGAELELWGPPTGGQVHIDWYIISFTVRFGQPPKKAPGFLDWKDFQSLLPQNDTPRLGAETEADANADPVPLTNLIKPAIAEGRIPTTDGRWVVRGDALVLAVETAFPLTLVELAGGPASAEIKPRAADSYVAVRPMGISGVTSKMTLRINGAGGAQDLAKNWNVAPIARAVPAALWGKPLPEGATPNGPSAETLPDRIVGVEGFAPQTAKPKGLDPIPLANLSISPINADNSQYLPLSAREGAVARQPRTSPTSLQTIASSIASTSVTLRGQLFDALNTFGFHPGANDAMTNVAANVNDAYPDAPMLGAPWQGAA